MTKIVHHDFCYDLEDGSVEFRVFGFTVEDPTGSVQRAEDNGKIQDFIEHLESDILDATIDSIYFPTEEFWAGQSSELTADELERMRQSAQHLYEFFTGLGGVVGKLREIVVSEADLGDAHQRIRDDN